MSFGKYFASPVTVTLELLASIAVRSDGEFESAVLSMISPNDRARFHVLLSSLRQLPIELQQFMSQKVLDQYELSNAIAE